MQPRYLLPLLTILVATAGLSFKPTQKLSLPKAPAISLGVLLSISAMVAYWANIQRYIAGQQHPLIEGTLPIKWEPLLGVPFIPVNFITAAATCVWLVGLFLWVGTSKQRASSAR